MEQNILNEVLTFAEAEKRYGLARGTLRKYASYHYEGRWKEGIDYRRSEGIWIIKKESMDRVYGERP